MTPTTGEQRILFDQRVPMRDGVTLSADVYLPAARENEDRWPVVLTRTPYVKANERTTETGKSFAGQGYVFVAMDVRGRGDSDGEFTPYVNDGQDGYDAIEWCAAQPWSDGNVGTLGASYNGCIQWLTAVLQPPHLRAMIVLVPPSDPFVENPTGVHSPMDLCWQHYVAGRTLHPMSQVDWARIYETLPLIEMDERAGRRSRPWREDLAHPRLDDYWAPRRYQNQFERVNVPVLHISGWYDDEQIGTPLNFAGMTARGATPAVRASQRLLMGPWGHAVNTVAKLGDVDFGSQALIDLQGEEMRWFDRWLKGTEGAEPQAPVRIFVMGRNEWRNEREWPLARTRWTPYYLHSGGHANSRFGNGALSTEPPAPGAPSDTYRYDPARPVPFITEPTSSQIGGPDDYAAVERRDDVLVYVTEPLAEELEVTGPILVDLYAASAARDTDFTAKLVDVWPNGFVQRLSDGIVRARFRDGMEHPTLIEPGRIYHYQIDCWNTSRVFKPGHRVGLEVSSSAFPKYARNLNSGADLAAETEMVVAEQTVFADAEHSSAIILPVIPRA